MRAYRCGLVAVLFGCVAADPAEDPQAPLPATPTPTIGAVEGSVLDDSGAAIDATVFLLMGSIEHSAHTDAAGRFTLPDFEPGPSVLQVVPLVDEHAPLEVPLEIDAGGLTLDLTLSALSLQPIPDVATPLDLGAGVQLTVGHDVLAGVLGASEIGAAAVDIASLDVAAPADAVAAWCLFPLVTPSEPLDAMLSVDLPDGTYELVTSSTDSWISAGLVELAGGVADTPTQVERLGTWVLLGP